MSSTSRRQFLSNRLPGARTRLYAVLILVLVAAVIGAGAVSASNDRSSLTGQLFGFFGISASSQSVQDDKSGALPRSSDDTGGAKSAKGCDSAPAGLVACYRGDADANDSTGVHNGTWVGDFGYAAGKVGTGAFSFNGQSRIEVPNAADLNPENLTLDGWVQLSSTNATFSMVSKGDQYALEVRNGELFFVSRNAAGELSEISGGSIKTFEWTHIAATHDGTSRHLYMNGEEVAAGKQAGLFTGDESALVIGSTITKAPNFTGMADEVQIYGRALTGDEIKDLAKTNKPEDITSYTITPSTVNEADGFTTISVTRDGTLNGNAISINFTVVGGTAQVGNSCTAGIDYVLSSNSISYVGGETGTKTIAIQICDDLAGESTETATIRGTLVGGQGGVPFGEWFTATQTQTQDVTFSITDNDTVSVTNNRPDGAREGNPTVTQAITFTYVPNGNLGNYTFTFTGAAQGGTTNGAGVQDFTATSNCSTFTYVPTAGPGTQTGTIGNAANAPCQVTVTPVADDFVETNESVIFTVTNPPNAPGGGVVSASAINNDDSPVVSVVVDGINQAALCGFGPNAGTDVACAQFAEEGDPGAGTTLTYTFYRGLCAAATPNGNQAVECPGGDPAALTNASYTYTATGTATPGTDYPNPASSPATIAFTGTNLSATQVVDPTNDTIVENDETVTFTVTCVGNSACRVSGTKPAATAGINDDDENISIVAVPANPNGVPEGPVPGTITYTFTRNFGSAGPDQINSGFLATQPINPVGDAINVNFAFTDGPPPTLANCSDFTFAGLPIDPVTPTGACTGFISFAGNDLGGDVLVTPVNDTLAEANEIVRMQVAANTFGTANNYGIGGGGVGGAQNTQNGGAIATNGGQADGLILNDDCVVTLTEAPPSVNEGDAGLNTGTPVPGPGVFTFTTTGTGCTANVVRFTTSGSATPTTDFTVTGAGVTYNPANGQGTVTTTTVQAPVNGVEVRTGTVNVNVVGDTTVENNEEVQVQIDPFAGVGQAYTFTAPAQQSVIIVDNDSVSVSVAAQDANAVEGTTANTDTLTFRFTRTDNGPTACAIACPAITVVYDINTIAPPANAADAADFQHPPNMGNNVVVIPANTLFVDVIVVPAPDAVVEPNDIIRVTVQSGAGYNAGLNGNGQFFADGTILNDDNTVACTAPTGGPGGTPTVVPEGGTLTFTCTRTSDGAAAGLPLDIPFAVTGTATFGGGNDYTIGGNAVNVVANGNGATGILRIPAGANSSGTVTIISNNDNVPEPDETVIVTFNGGNATGTDNTNTIATTQGGATTRPQTFSITGTTQTGTIANNDQNVSVSGGGTVAENSGTDLVFTFTRDTGGINPNPGGTNALSTAVTVSFQVSVPSGGVAGATGPAFASPPQAGNTPATGAGCNGATGVGAFADYNFLAGTGATAVTFNGATCIGTISFPANNVTPNATQSVQLLARPINDATVEPLEGLRITIINDGTGNYAAANNANGNLFADGFISNDDTAIAAAALCQNGVPVFPANGSTIVCGNNVSVINGVLGGGNFEGDTNTLTDNNLTPHGSTAVFRVTRTGNLQGEQRVDISTIPTGAANSGTATSGSPNTACGLPGVDYISDGKTIVFPDAGVGATGTQEQFFYVAVCGDLLIEADETINVQVTNPQPGPNNNAGGSVNVPTAVSTWVIYNDDGVNPANGNPNVFLRANNAEAVEGQPVVFTVCLYTGATPAIPPAAPGAGDTLLNPALNGVNITFDYDTNDNTAIDGVDYTGVTGSGTIPAGSNCSAPISVATITDVIFEGRETFFFDVTNTTPGTGPGGTFFIGTGQNNPVTYTDFQGNQVTVNATNPANPPRTHRAIGSILDANTPSNYSIRDVRQAEGNGGDNATSFNFQLTQNIANNFPAGQQICWVTRSGDVTQSSGFPSINGPAGGLNPAQPGFTATNTGGPGGVPADYTGIGELAGQQVNCATFAQGGNATQTINIPVIVNGDTIPEPDETFSVILGTVSGGVFTPLPTCPTSGTPTGICAAPNADHPGNVNYNGVGIGTIQNDDASVTAGITTAGVNAVNGGTTLETNSGTFAIPVTISFSGGFQGTVTIPYTVTAGPAPPVTLGAAGTVPTFSGNPGTSSSTGSCGSQTTPAGVDMYVPAAGQTGAGSFTVTGTGFANQTFTINLVGCGDVRPELNENFTIALGTATGAPVVTAAPATAGGANCTTTSAVCGNKVGTIIDNDPLGPFFFAANNTCPAGTPDFQQGDVCKLEGSTPGATTPFDFVFTNGGPAADYQIQATLETVDGTATSSGTPATGQDYQPRTNAGGNACVVTFAAGSTTGTPSASCTVLVNQDLTQEADETFTYQVTGFNTGQSCGGFAGLGNTAGGTCIPFNPATFGTNVNPAPVGTDLIAQGVILNDDGVPVFTANVVNNQGVVEGTNTPYTDFPRTPFTVRIERTGTSSVNSTFTIQIPQQNVPSGNTTLARGGTDCTTANNVSAGTATIGGQSVTQPGADYVISGPVTVTFYGGAGTGSGYDYVDVTYGTIGVDSAAPVQGSGIPGGGNPNLLVAGGICRDQRLEANEVIPISLAAGLNSAVNNAASSGVTIINDDSVTMTMTQNVTGNEGNDPNNPTAFDFTVTRTGLTSLSPGLTAANFVVTGSGANPATVGAACGAGVDVLNTVQILNATGLNPSNNTTDNQTVRVFVCGDVDPEATETFTLTATIPNSNGTGATNTVLTGTGTITNDDGGVVAPLCGATAATRCEGDQNRTNAAVKDTYDGKIDGDDLTWYDLFANGQRCWSTGPASEWQALDTSPLASLGNGAFDLDRNQLERYIAGLDAKRLVGGPQAPNAPLTCSGVGADIDTGSRAEATNAPRTARIVNGSGPAGGFALVPIDIEASGNEVTFQGTIHFGAGLSISAVAGTDVNPDITLGPGAPAGTRITVNTSNIANGDIGIVVNFNGNATNPATTLPSGTRRVAVLKFTIAGNAQVGSVIPVTFNDNVFTTKIGDSLGGTLATTFINGNVTVTGARALHINDSTTRVGQPALVPVRLENAQGNEYTVSTSLNFDPVKLSVSNVAGTGNTDVISGPTLPPGCTRNINTSQLAQGRIGITISCPTSGAPIPAGAQTIYTVRFTPTAAAVQGDVIPVTFGDSPFLTTVGDVNAVALQFTPVNGVVNILGPTAADVTISGHVFAPGGAGLRNATVTLTDSNGETRSVVTSTFGAFSFDGVTAGETYVVGVSSRRYRFSPRVVQVTDSLSDLDFTGVE